MINNISLEGFISEDIDFEKVSNDKLVVNFVLSVPRTGRAKEKQAADTFYCVAWNQIAKRVINQVKKGQLISIVGHVESGTYKDRDLNKNAYSTKVVVDKLHILDNWKANK